MTDSSDVVARPANGRTILLDLDGTLVDPAVGIIEGFRRGLAALGAADVPADQLGWIIGPSLRISYGRLVGPGVDVEIGVRGYRDYYGREGLYNATPYPGMHDAVKALRARYAKVLICTAKPEVFARRVAAHFGFDTLVDGLYGPDLEGKLDNKGDLMAHIRECEPFDPAKAVMIGDRHHDIDAARRHGIASIGVLWGYGSENELTGAGATALCRSPSELPEMVARLLG